MITEAFIRNIFFLFQGNFFACSTNDCIRFPGGAVVPLGGVVSFKRSIMIVELFHQEQRDRIRTASYIVETIPSSTIIGWLAEAEDWLNNFGFWGWLVGWGASRTFGCMENYRCFVLTIYCTPHNITYFELLVTLLGDIFCSPSWAVIGRLFHLRFVTLFSACSRCKCLEPFVSFVGGIVATKQWSKAKPPFFFKKNIWYIYMSFFKTYFVRSPVGVLQQEIYGAGSALMTISPFQSYKELSGCIPTAPLCCFGMHWWYDEFASTRASRNMILFDCSYKAAIYIAFLNCVSYKNCSCRFMPNSITSLYATELTLLHLRFL